MKKNNKISTFILFVILVILIIIYLFIPNTRTKVKHISKEEYIDKLYSEMKNQKEEQENLEQQNEDENNEDNNEEDMLLKVNN